jgi:hypothetical protein
MTSARRIDQPDERSAMCSAFLDALARRVGINPSGQVVLPTGAADGAEISKVLRALDRVRQMEGR